MYRNSRICHGKLVLGLVLIGGLATTVWADSELADITWDRAMNVLAQSKDVIDLDDAEIRIEVNSTDGDAGFQIELDGEGWRAARVFAPNGRVVARFFLSGGVRHIGGATELFMETEEPEYDDLDGLRELIELLDEGDYMFFARTTGGDWATGEAELTHTVPAGPEILAPLPGAGSDCAEGVLVDFAVIEWYPVEETIFGSSEIEIEAYQVIVETEEDPERTVDMIVPAGTTAVTVPPEILDPGTEYKFEILAIEESGNQTITESCFVTAD